MQLNLSLLITSLLFISIIGYGQTPQQIDSINKSEIDWTRYIDSVEANTTIKQFVDFLDGTVTSKFFREGTLANLRTYFLNQKYPIWLKEWNDKHKKKP